MLQQQQQRQQMQYYSHHQQHIHQRQQLTHITTAIVVTIICIANATHVNAGVFYPRGGSFGYLAAVAIPLDLPNRNVYMAFNFESNYGLPSNDSYNEWIDRWDLDENFLSIGNNVTAINGRQLKKDREKRHSLLPRHDRRSFYRTFTGYLDHYQMNGTGCLLRTICEVAALTMEENNGVLGSILKILFMPTTSRPEIALHNDMNDQDLYQAEWQGRQHLAETRDSQYESNAEEHDENDGDGGAGDGGGGGDDDDNTKAGDLNNACLDYSHWCPEGVINMISTWY